MTKFAKHRWPRDIGESGDLPNVNFHVHGSYNQRFASNENVTIDAPKSFVVDSVFDTYHFSEAWERRPLVRGEQKPVLLTTHLLSKFSLE